MRFESSGEIRWIEPESSAQSSVLVDSHQSRAPAGCWKSMYQAFSKLYSPMSEGFFLPLISETRQPGETAGSFFLPKEKKPPDLARKLVASPVPRNMTPLACQYCRSTQARESVCLPMRLRPGMTSSGVLFSSSRNSRKIALEKMSLRAARSCVSLGYLEVPFERDAALLELDDLGDLEQRLGWELGQVRVYFREALLQLVELLEALLHVEVVAAHVHVDDEESSLLAVVEACLVAQHRDQQRGIFFHLTLNAQADPKVF